MANSTTWSHYIDFMKSRGNIENIMIISSDTGALWACSPEEFYLREYKAIINQEDGSEVEETVNEAASILAFINGKSNPHGLRLNGTKKQQVIKNFKDEETGLTVIYGKITQGGSCTINAGKCIIIATFNELNGHTAAACNDIITMMARYLNKSTWPNGEAGSASVVTSGGDAAGLTWQPYIEKMLIGKGDIEEACICSAVDGTVFASTKDFQIQVYDAEIPQEDGTDKLETVDEKSNLIQLMNGTKPTQGLRINKVKYQIVKQFEEENSGCYSIYGKKTRGGICLVITPIAIIIGTFDENKNHTAANCNSVISDLAKYLNKKK